MGEKKISNFVYNIPAFFGMPYAIVLKWDLSKEVDISVGLYFSKLSFSYW